MLTEHRIKMNETFPSIVGFLSGNYGFEVRLKYLSLYETYENLFDCIKEDYQIMY